MHQTDLITESLEQITASPVECLTGVLEKICLCIDNCQFGVILIVNNHDNTMALDVLHGYPQEDALRFRNERRVFKIGEHKLDSIDALLAKRAIITLGEDSKHSFPVSRGVKKTLSYPIKHADEWVAVLTLESKNPRAFDEYRAEVDGGVTPPIIKLCGSLVSAALTMRRSLVFEFDEFIRRNNFDDFDKLGEQAVSWVSKTFNVDSCAIYFRDYKHEIGDYVLECKSSKLGGALRDTKDSKPYRKNEGYTGWIYTHSHSLFLPEFENERSAALKNYGDMFDRPERSGRLKAEFGDLTFKSYLGVPLISDSRTVGVLEILDATREYAFSDEALLEIIGNRIAQEYLRISRDMRRDYLFGVPHPRAADLQKVIRGVVDSAMKLTEATHGFFMYKGEDGRLTPRAVKGYGLSKEEIPVVEADRNDLVTFFMNKRTAFRCNNVEEGWCKEITDPALTGELKEKFSRTFLPKGVKSLLLVPVYIEEKHDDKEKEYTDLGVLELMSYSPNAFHESEVVITAIAEIAGYSIQLRKTWNELEAEQAQVLRLEQGLNIYNRIVTAAATSAGTVHTAKKHIRDITPRIEDLRNSEIIKQNRHLRALIEPAYNGIKELNELYDRLHDVFAGIEPKLEPCDLADIIQEARTYMQPTFKERRVGFSNSVKPRLITVEADILLMKVVIINLIRNSIEAGAQDIRVRAKRVKRDRRGFERDCVQVTFTDNGSGLPEEEWERIFDPFVTYDKKGGTGLGLAVNRDILNKHDGEIKVTRSELGVGTDITLTLPLPRSAAANGN